MQILLLTASTYKAYYDMSYILTLILLLSTVSTVSSQLQLEDVPLHRRCMHSMVIPPPPPPPPPPYPTVDEIQSSVPLHQNITVYQNPTTGSYYHVYQSGPKTYSHKYSRYGLKKLDGEIILKAVFTSLEPIPQAVKDSSALRFITRTKAGLFNVYDIYGQRFFRQDQAFIATATTGYLVITPPTQDTTYLIHSDGNPVTEPDLGLLNTDFKLISRQHTSHL